MTQDINADRRLLVGLNVNRRKRPICTVNRQDKAVIPAVKRFQGLSNITISASHPGLLAFKKNGLNGKPVSMFPDIRTST